jgi:hypothetical protein
MDMQVWIYITRELFAVLEEIAQDRNRPKVNGMGQ